jgi:hypothetical protein
MNVLLEKYRAESESKLSYSANTLRLQLQASGFRLSGMGLFYIRVLAHPSGDQPETMKIRSYTCTYIHAYIYTSGNQPEAIFMVTSS